MTKRWLDHAAVPAACILVLGVLLISHAQGADWNRAWQNLHILPMPAPALNPGFADLRTITHSLDAVRAGADPYVDTDFDPWFRVFNYPRAWLWLAATGIGAKDTALIGGLMAAALAACLTLLFKARAIAARALVFLLVLSPSVLELAERANCDIVILCGITLALFGAHRLPAPARGVVEIAMVAITTTLKIYPIAASVVALRDRRSAFVPFVAAAVGLLALFLSLRSGDLAFVLNNTPQRVLNSFGSPILPTRLAPLIGVFTASQVRTFSIMLAIGAASAGAALFHARRANAKRYFPTLTRGAPRDDVALATLAIFLFAYTLGTNFDYRLIFLAASTPPFLVAFDSDRDERLLVFPLLVVAYTWLSAFPALDLDDALGWVVYVLAAGWLALTLGERLAPRAASLAAVP